VSVSSKGGSAVVEVRTESQVLLWKSSISSFSRLLAWEKRMVLDSGLRRRIVLSWNTADACAMFPARMGRVFRFQSSHRIHNQALQLRSCRRDDSSIKPHPKTIHSSTNRKPKIVPY